MKRKALLVGINYPKTSSELHGCVNDVLAMREMLTDHYNFAATDITMLTDYQATTANMLAELENLVKDTKPGDVIFFHYSGHGSQMYDSTSDNDNETDGMDEILCPIDLDWRTKVIRDDDLKRIFDKIPNGVHFTVVLDCCNSGGGMDHTNQYQPSVNRSIVVEEVTNRAVTENMLNRYLPPPAEIIEEANKLNITRVKPRMTNSRHVDDTGLMISGCQADQTSADAYINGKYMGACTYYITRTLKDNNYSMSYQDLVDTINQRLAKAGFTQRPELNGDAIKFSMEFLRPFNDDVIDQDNQEPQTPQPTPVPAQQENKPHGFWAKLIHAIMSLFGLK